EGKYLKQLTQTLTHTHTHTHTDTHTHTHSLSHMHIAHTQSTSVKTPSTCFHLSRSGINAITTMWTTGAHAAKRGFPNLLSSEICIYIHHSLNPETHKTDINELVVTKAHCYPVSRPKACT